MKDKPSDVQEIWRPRADQPAGARGLILEEPLIFERGAPGRSRASLPAPGVPEIDPADEIPSAYLRTKASAPHLPEVSEPEVVRHVTRLSQLNYGIDTGMFPLGSCTMKYNPRVNEAAAAMSNFAGAHPYLSEDRMQGPLELMWRLERALAEIGGFAAVTLQPAAGAHGELAGVMMMRAYHDSRGNALKTKVLVPTSAHGTNPATSALAGYSVVEIPSGPQGYVLPETVAEAMTDEIAGLLITNPNTLGIFERHIAEIARIVHEKDGIVYCDGANMNAILGKVRPGTTGVDVMHYNLHKTFSTPHGGGGPGAGPVGVGEKLLPFLPTPVVAKEGERYFLDHDLPESIGRLKAFYGNFGVLVRAYTFIREMGAGGLRSLSEAAVLNANYLRAGLLRDENGAWHLPFEVDSLHEAVFSDKGLKDTGCTTMDVAKRLIDLGFHPPTVYFPLVVAGALMIEPTESETKETIDAFVNAMGRIAKEARESPGLLTGAPTSTARGRLDEVRAARCPILRWTPDLDEKILCQTRRGGKGPAQRE